MKSQIVPSADIEKIERKAPATRLKESLPAGLLSTEDVAERFGCNIETVRRLARKKDADGNKVMKAPSKAARRGRLFMWVYTPEDIQELAEYFGEKAPRKRGRKK